MAKKLSILVLFIVQLSFSQVGIGTTNPNASSALDITSTNSGLLIPRVSLTSSTDNTTIAAPATSLMVYNTNTANDITPGFYYWEGSWKKFSSGTTPTGSTGGWNLTGNTVTGTDYLGTNNYFPLIFRVNGSQFSRFHPNGGLAIGNGAAANDNNSVAIGTSASATTSNQAVAIGPSSNAAGYQSVAIGLNSATSNNSTVAIGSSSNASGHQSFSFGLASNSSNNNGFAIGNSSVSSGQQAFAIGQEANSSGQNAMAIGYQATATQANSIILGSTNNGNNRVGIGTNSPDERLHIVGGFKLVDGTQTNGYVLGSDANGKASWINPATLNYGWRLTGNTATSTDFLGTTNAIPLVFRVNNNQFARFHQAGGLAIGNNAAANDNNGIAIGTSATATNSNQGIAIGQSSNASGYQSMAIGLSAAASSNSSAAVGNSSLASGQNATAIGASASATGQNATAIGYQAATSQANAIVLGNSSNTNARVGIGTNAPDEKLHVTGSVKIVDGTQANNYVLTSDAAGRASWKAPAASAWSLTGNSAVSTDFLGTTNNIPLIFRVNNTQFSRFHSSGGLAIGVGASANDTNGIAVGTSASASGQNSTAIGYQSTTSQANAIVLGSTNTNSKIGIGTNAPDERLHVAGSVKIVDGTQANNYVLTSDANGKASWKAPAAATVTTAFGELYRNSNLTLASGAVNFGTNGATSSNITLNNGNTIQVQLAGTYRVTYNISVRNTGSSTINPEFFLTIWGNEVPGTRSYMTLNNGQSNTVSVTKILNLNAWEGILVHSSLGDSNASILANGASMTIELIR